MNGDKSQRFADVYNPALGEVIARVPLAGEDDIVEPLAEGELEVNLYQARIPDDDLAALRHIEERLLERLRAGQSTSHAQMTAESVIVDGEAEDLRS